MISENEFIILVASILEVDPNQINLSTTKEDFPEWDSLGHLKLFMGLEDKLRVHFSTEEIEKLKDLNSIYNKIC